MTRKVYQSLHFQTLDTYVQADGNKVQVLFRGGSLKPKINGKYSTTDPAIMAEMDKGLKRPRCAYKLVSVEDDGTPEPVTAAKFVAEKPKETIHADVPDDFTKVEGITNVQKARDYLVANIEGMTAAKLPNGAAIRTQAATHKIVFTDWK